MKRESLKQLGLDKEAIDRVMLLHQGDVENNKKVLNKQREENSILKKQMQDMKVKLDILNTIDIDQLQKESTFWKSKYEQELQCLKFEYALQLAIINAKPKNPEILKKLIDDNNMQYTQEFLQKVTQQIQRLKETDYYLFE